jgi:hypothetical protein
MKSRITTPPTRLIWIMTLMIVSAIVLTSLLGHPRPINAGAEICVGGKCPFPVSTATLISTPLPADTLTPTPTETSTETVATTNTETPQDTATETAPSTATETPSLTPTFTPTATETPCPTETCPECPTEPAYNHTTWIPIYFKGPVSWECPMYPCPGINEER